MKDFNHKYSPKGNPYKVPDGYFEQKQKDLLAIAEIKTVKTTTTRQLWWISGLVAAAMLAAVYIFPEKQETTLSPEYVEYYLFSEYSYTMTEEAIYSELDNEQLLVDEEWSFNEEGAEEFLENNFDQILHYEYY